MIDISFQIDIQTLIICGVLLLMALTTPFCSPFFRKPDIVALEGTPDVVPHFSIIVAVHDQEDQLRRNLPKLLDQQYDGFEVIVVDESSTDDTRAYLDQVKEQYHNLYTTFVPGSAQYVSRRKVAMTLGVRAAKYEWLVFADIDSYPVSDQWLTTLARYTERADMVCTYTSLEDEAKGYWRFRQLMSHCYLVKRPYRYEGSCLAMRKQLFTEQGGFTNNLRYLRGEYDYLVNELGNEAEVAFMTEPEGRFRQEVPSMREWSMKRLVYMETRRHLRRTFVPRLLFNFDELTMHLNFLLILVAAAYGVMTQNVFVCGAAVLAAFITFLLRTVFAYRAIHAFGEDLSVFAIDLKELRVVWTNLRLWLKHRFTDRYVFIRK